MIKEAKVLLGDARRMLRQHVGRLTAEGAEEMRSAVVSLEAALEAGMVSATRDAVRHLDERVSKHLAFARKSALREYVESIGVAVLIALFLRSFVIEAFKIPSGSMIPTLQVGDHIFVNKYLYGIRVPGTDVKLFRHRQPQRGEVVVFRFPNPNHLASEEDKDFIKRIVAVGGDQVEVRNRTLYVNGRAVPQRELASWESCRYQDVVDENSGVFLEKRCESFEERLGGHTFTTYFNPGGGGQRDWPPRNIPPGTVFVMGDNRDNSHDSRYWGTVPLDLVKGRAMFIWWSRGQDGMRWPRMFSAVP